MSTGFHRLPVAQIWHETSEAIAVRLTVPSSLAEAYRFQPGQHVTVRAEIAGEDVRRSYSICSVPTDEGLCIAIKRVPGGRFSNWANSNLVSGATLEVMPPTGAFTWVFDAVRRGQYAMFASGSGITPILSLLKTGLAAEPTSHFALFYGNRDTNNIIFREEIAQLKNRYLERLQVHHFLSREEDDFEILNGRIDRAKVDQILSNLLPAAAIDRAFVCGPEDMMAAVQSGLINAEVSQDRIQTERFTASELSSEQKEAVSRLERQAAGKPIRVRIDGRRRTLTFDPALGSVLDNARAAGLPAPFSCKAGVCATCRGRVVSGKVEMVRRFGLSDADVADGYVLTCQAIPVTDDVEIDFDG